LKEQLSFLVALQKFDAEMNKSNLKKKELPVKRAKLDEGFEKLKTDLNESRNRYESFKKSHKEKEDKLKRGQESITKTKERLFEVKTNKEYQAVLKEIETIEAKNSEIEDDVIKTLEDIDQLKVKLDEEEKGFDTCCQQYERDKKDLEQEITSIETDLLSYQQRIFELRKQIGGELLKKYETIKRIRNGLAVVSVWKEVCHGCHMNIPPQLYNDLQKSEDLLSCPNCNRIIYWQNQNNNV
jgi:hypothetical protein